MVTDLNDDDALKYNKLKLSPAGKTVLIFNIRTSALYPSHPQIISAIFVRILHVGTSADSYIRILPGRFLGMTPAGAVVCGNYALRSSVLSCGQVLGTPGRCVDYTSSSLNCCTARNG